MLLRSLVWIAIGIVAATGKTGIKVGSTIEIGGTGVGSVTVVGAIVTVTMRPGGSGTVSAN